MAEKTLLSFFWDLASTNEKIRIDAAVNLIKHLKVKEKEKENSVTEDEENQSDDLSYTLKRLLKGLGSSRKSARQGFAMALTEVTLLFNHITVDKIMKELKESLVVTKSCSNQEERDAYFGQIFGLATLGRVICLAHQSENTSISKSSITQVVESLKELLVKKSYLQEICYKAMVDIMSMLKFDEFKEYLFPVLENIIKCNWEKCTPDSLILVLATWRLFKDEIGHKTFKKSWKSSHLDSIENYSLLAKILQNSHNAHPRVHYVWEEVFHLVLNSSASNFEKFWATVIDENLFQSSHERKFLGFKLLEKVLPMLSVEQVKVVFSCHLMHCLFNSLGHDNNYLYAATKQMMENFGKILVQKEKQTLIIEIIKQLLGRNGNVWFDAATKTKTVENLLPKIPVEDLPNFISWMKEIFTLGTTKVEDDSDPKSIEKTREGILGLFLSLIRCKQLAHTSSWVLDAVYFIFNNAYFIKVEPKPSSVITSNGFPQVNHRTRIICQQRFNSILGELATLSAKAKTPIGTDNKDASTMGKVGYADDGCLWISHIMHHAKALLKSTDHKIAEESWTDEVQKLFGKTMKIVTKLEQKSGKLTLENYAFSLMFLYVGAQLFSEPQQSQDILEELFQCYDKVNKETQENEPPWMDVVTEILLSFLTESSNLRRQVVDQVFNIIVPHLTSSALNIILEAIDPRNGLNDNSSLQVETVSDSDDNDEEEDMNLENVKSENDENDTNEEDLSEDNESDEDEEQDSVDPLFKVDLQAALGNALVNEDSDDNDDDAKESDDDLDDEAMMKLDDALSEVFKQHLKARDEKKNAKDAKKSILHFKLRVLDLVDILIKKQPCSVLILELIQPLLNIIRVSLGSKDYLTLGERAQGIFKNKLCAIKEYPEPSSSYIESVHSNIESLLQQAMKAPSVTMVTLMSTGCLFLVRQLRASVTKEKGKSESKTDNSDDKHDKTNEFPHMDLPRLKKAYCEALEDFMLHRNTHLHPLLFQELINRYPVIGWGLAEDLVKYISQGINNFRKIQACIMLSQLLNRKVPSYIYHIKRLVKPLQEAFHITFNQLSSSDAEMKAKHLRQILKLATRFLKIIKTESDVWPLLDVNGLERSLDAVSKSKTVERAHDLKNLISRLNSELTGESTNGDVKSKKKRKRKRSGSEKNNNNKTVPTNNHEIEDKKSETRNKTERKKKRKSKTNEE